MLFHCLLKAAPVDNDYSLTNITCDFVDGAIRSINGKGGSQSRIGKKTINPFKLSKNDKIVVVGTLLLHHQIVGCLGAWGSEVEGLEFTIKDESRVVELIDDCLGWVNHRKGVTAGSKKRIVAGTIMPGLVE